jgi:tetratricopeptide (TPR) repeat protein
LGQYEQAIDLIGPLLDDPESSPLERVADQAAGLITRGVARLHLDQTGSGIADFRAAARLDPQDTLALENLVLAYMQTGQFQRARACLRRAERQQPAAAHLRQLRLHLRLRWLKHRLSQWRRGG